MPGLRFLVAIADAGNVSIDWLATGVDKNRNSMPSSCDSPGITRLEGDASTHYTATVWANRNSSDSPESKVAIREKETQLLEAASGETVDLLAIYKDAPPEGRRALAALAVAIRDRTLRAWLAAGQAIAETAQLFDRTK